MGKFYKISAFTFVMVLALSFPVSGQGLGFDKQFFEAEMLTARQKYFQQTESEGAEKWDLTYNRLTLEVDPAVNYISGNVYFEFESLVNRLEKVSIDLSGNMNVHAVTCNGHGLEFVHRDNRVEIMLPETLDRNEMGTFEIVYEGDPAATGFGSFQQSFHNGFPVITTLSQPEGARNWWPCKQSLSDKIDSIDVIVTSPLVYRTASNGVLVADILTGNTRTCHWQHRHPIATYLVFISTTNYAVFTDEVVLPGGENVEIVNYVYPEQLEEAREKLSITGDYLYLYSELFTGYPFSNEKYGHAQCSWGGGMEHQTMSSMGSFSRALIAHEMAHQWFGDFITCESWNEIWLNEGFATYLTALTYEHFWPKYWDDWRKGTVDMIKSEPGGSVYVYDATGIERIFDSRLSYYKAAYVLHMLRGQLGDALFFESVRSYLRDARAVNGFAATSVLKENFELVADTTLDEFFADWVYGEGYPVIQMQWASDGKEIQVKLEQAPSVTGGPFFEMKMPCVVYENGEESVHWLHQTQNNQLFSIDFAGNPDSVIFDPEDWVLCEKTSTQAAVSVLFKPEISMRYSQLDKEIHIDIPRAGEADIYISGLNGKKMQHKRWSSFHKQFSLSGFSPGIYIVTVVSEKVTRAEKIFVY
ncbi:MAG: hypothetical protein K9H26_13890 [Prolixibacteraceae bacterium]|nr:hypothetical protein [Prolixibacteraceae bacterium]